MTQPEDNAQSRMAKHAVQLSHAAAVCALGSDQESITEGLFNGDGSPLSESDEFSPGRTFPLGHVSEPLPVIGDSLHNTRNNQLLLAVMSQLPMQQIFQKVPADRVGVIIGSSTSGILEGEQAIAHHEAYGDMPGSFDYRQQEVGAPAKFVAQHLGAEGPCWTISTACSSGAKALASAQRLLQSGLCDVVIAGGADSLCRLTVQGFNSLAAVSEQVCNPFSANRNGINIGEGAALFVIHKPEIELGGSPVGLCGYGESSDAHHISAPHPDGAGAVAAMKTALEMAGLPAGSVDYLNLHGTATKHNDSMEAKAVKTVFANDIACSSSKPLTGHTLGAAGALEAYFGWLILLRKDGRLPRALWDGEYDSQIPVLAGYGREKLGRAVNTVLSNSFAFGGNNISLLMGRL